MKQYNFLNNLNFKWSLPYNNDVIDGFWMYDGLDHPHPQWIFVKIQSNPMWFTTWGIQKLCNIWKFKAASLFSAPNNVFTSNNPQRSLDAYNNACRAEYINDYDTYRKNLDMIVLLTEIDLVTHVCRNTIDTGGTYIDGQKAAFDMRDKFCEAFS